MARAAAWLKPVPLNLAPRQPLRGDRCRGEYDHRLGDGPGSRFKVVEGARHGAGGAGFAALPDFSASPMFDNSAPVVAMNAAGKGIVAWVHDFGMMGNEEVELRTVTAAGVTGPVQSVSGSSGGFTHIAIAINATGDAVVAWVHNANTVEAITRQGAQRDLHQRDDARQHGSQRRGPERGDR